MSDRPERPIMAADFTMSGNPVSAGSVSMGKAAPIGAVSGKDRLRAERTALHREPPSTLVLDTELPGKVQLQRRAADGTWETLETRRVGRRGGRTRISLPDDDASSSAVFRVKFAPKNANIASWTSENVDR